MKNRRSVYNKLLIAYVVFAALSFMTVSFFSSERLKSYLLDRQADNLSREISTLANFYTSETHIRGGSPEMIFGYLKSVASYSNCEIWVVDATGRVVMNTSDPSLSESSGLVINEFDPVSIRGHMVGNFYDHFDEEMLTVYAPLNLNFKLRGYLITHCSVRSVLQRSEEILRIIYATMGIILILSLIILLVFTVVVYWPLRKITIATEEYAKGNYEYPLSASGGDEMAYLAGTLGYMASEIAKTEDNEKKFIANVSHDFKSPLTSIRGYLEAMRDGTIPPELHGKYLGIVLNETDRLTKLTGSLLQLNNLNVKGILLDIKDFDINSMIKQTCETFEGRCLERHIFIELVLTEEEMAVTADEGKIQQVLYNLLDNAIKFSPDHSTIKIETTQRNEKLFVSVKDSGVGIPKESLGKVFDRFFKTDPSRGKDKKGTGLGLAIVKEIIKAHDENINVISTEGVGTEFIFSLKLAD